MKAEKSYKQWIARLRKFYGKKNGVVSTAIFDVPKREREYANSKKNKKHRINIK